MLATLGIYLGELMRIIENLKHSSGGFNQHFAPLQNSMEKIEQQINLLTTEIKAVSSQIETIEFYLKKASSSWTEEEKETYGTKEQLRSEKEQLRRKEEQLLEQKTILMKKEAEGMIIKES
jgi:predicted  nucleic acid-binding Zn-ribbon protein